MMKRLIKSFSLFLVFAFLISMFYAKPVKANYEHSKNKVSISVGNELVDNSKKLALQISVQYQRGFDKNTASYWVCRQPDGFTYNSPADCSSENTVIGTNSNTGGVGFVTTGSVSDYISKEPGSVADKNPTTKSFKVITSLNIGSTNREDTYVVFVAAYFCGVRTSTNDGVFNSCQYFYNSNQDENGPFVRKEFKVDDVLNLNISEIGDEGISEAMEKIENIVMNVLLPIIWAVLGLFLVIKGSLLGMQIVKSADEPQVRQEKIGALKWLVIGVAIAYLASGAVYVVTGFFSGAFNIK